MNTQALRDLEREILDLVEEGFYDEIDWELKLRGVARKLAVQIELHELARAA